MPIGQTSNPRINLVDPPKDSVEEWVPKHGLYLMLSGVNTNIFQKKQLLARMSFHAMLS